MPLWIDILTAPTFRFVIGKERKVFNVPTTLFEHVSEPLHTMATSQNFVEGRAGEAVIEDCEPEVFAAVCEFAYTASFDDPDHSGMLHEFKGDERLAPWRDDSSNHLPRSAGDTSNQNIVQGDTEMIGSAPRAAVPQVVSHNGFDWKDFRMYPYLRLDGSSSPFEEYWKVFGLLAQDLHHSTALRFDLEDDTPEEVFVNADTSLQCKIYVFAQRYLASGLQRLAIQRLRLAFNLYFSCPDELLESVDYTFANTERSESLNDPLRELLVGYACIQAKKLYTLSKFNDLLVRYPELAVDMGHALAAFLPES